jgi:hypothetical protein
MIYKNTILFTFHQLEQYPLSLFDQVRLFFPLFKLDNIRRLYFYYHRPYLSKIKKIFEKVGIYPIIYSFKNSSRRLSYLYTNPSDTDLLYFIIGFNSQLEKKFIHLNTLRPNSASKKRIPSRYESLLNHFSWLESFFPEEILESTIKISTMYPLKNRHRRLLLDDFFRIVCYAKILSYPKDVECLFYKLPVIRTEIFLWWSKRSHIFYQFSLLDFTRIEANILTQFYTFFHDESQLPIGLDLLPKEFIAWLKAIFENLENYLPVKYQKLLMKNKKQIPSRLFIRAVHEESILRILPSLVS